MTWMVHRRGASLKSSDVGCSSRSAPSSKWLCFALIAPMGLAVQVPVDSTGVADSTSALLDSTDAPVDSTSVVPHTVDTSYERVTKFTMGGGTGRYYRQVLFPYVSDCGTTGTYPVPFKEEYIDVGGEFDHQANRVAHVGVRGGYIDTDATLVGIIDSVFVGEGNPEQQTTFYLNPYFSFEWKWVGLGLGGLFSTHPLHDGGFEDYPIDTGAEIYPSAHVRFGSLTGLYVSGHLLEGVPVYSGGGTLVGGVGLRPVKPIELYAGYCGEGPYQDAAWLGRLTVDLGRSWTILTTLRFPTDFEDSGESSESEYGIGVGISYRLYTLTPGN